MDLGSIKYKMTSDDVMVVIDPSLNYSRKYYDSTKDKILSDKNHKIKWNIFKEILIDNEINIVDFPEKVIEEIYHNCRLVSKYIFADRHSISQPFFVNAAQEVLAAILYQSICCNINNLAEDMYSTLNNKTLREMFDLWDANDFCRFLSTNDSLTNIIRLISNPAKDYDGNLIVDKNNQLIYTSDDPAQCGVFQEVVIAVKDVINNVWAQQGGFSIRRYIRNRGARTLFLNISPSSDIHRILVNLILQENESSDERGEIFIVVPNERLLNSRYYEYLNGIADLYVSGSLQFIVGCDTKDSFYFHKLKDKYFQSIGLPTELPQPPILKEVPPDSW